MQGEPNSRIDSNARPIDATQQRSTRDATTTLARVKQALGARPTFAIVSEILGPPDHDIGSGIYVLVYNLSDGTRLVVGTSDKKSVLYVDHDRMRLYHKKAEHGM